MLGAAIIGRLRRRRLEAQLLTHALVPSAAGREALASRMALIASCTTSAVGISRLDGSVEWVNASFTRLFSYTSGDVIGRNLLELLHGPTRTPSWR